MFFLFYLFLSRNVYVICFRHVKLSTYVLYKFKITGVSSNGSIIDAIIVNHDCSGRDRNAKYDRAKQNSRSAVIGYAVDCVDLPILIVEQTFE